MIPISRVPTDGRRFRSWIEAPSFGGPASTHFVVRGWCHHVDGNAIRRVRARIGGRTFPGVYGDARPDVHAAFPDVSGAERSGYEIPVIAGCDVVCRLEAQLAGGDWRPFRVFAMRPQLASVSRERRKWTRFWRRAWHGLPDAWAAVGHQEGDYAVALTRVRGWFNLAVVPQYAPRPLAFESFPASAWSSDQLPRVTIVTPSFQQGVFLEQTMRSVLDQDGVRIDYIVQDGGSTDGSVDVIGRFAERLRCWESAPDAGQADAIVRGFAKSDGGPDDLMMYLNADDLLMPAAVRFVAEYFATHPDVDVVYGHRVFIDERGEEVGRWLTPRPEAHEFRLHNFVPQETLFWRRRIWNKVGGIDPTFHFALDWDLLLRFHAAGARMARLPWFLGLFRLHSQQKTNTRFADTAVPEIDRLRLRTLGRPSSRDELHLAMCRAQVDSALVSALLRRGRRV